jgi:hypothetical protein
MEVKKLSELGLDNVQMKLNNHIYIFNTKKSVWNCYDEVYYK